MRTLGGTVRRADEHHLVHGLGDGNAAFVKAFGLALSAHQGTGEDDEPPGGVRCDNFLQRGDGRGVILAGIREYQRDQPPVSKPGGIQGKSLRPSPSVTSGTHGSPVLPLNAFASMRAAFVPAANAAITPSGVRTEPDAAANLYVEWVEIAQRQ